jgi:hypothetical protein
VTRAERTILTVGEDGTVTSIQVNLHQHQAPDTTKWLWGWKEIGDALGRSERWARRKGKRIPVSWEGGRPCITLGDLYAWLKGQRAAVAR